MYGPGDGRLRCQNINVLYVSDLIDISSRSWKLDVLNALFDEDQGNRICSIPLSKLGMSDKLTWHCDGSGLYSVKSGYRLLRDDVFATNGRNSSNHACTLKRFYSELWSMSLSAKVKITTWRFFNNFVPTFDNLQSRRLAVNNMCVFCRSNVESIEHVLRDCWFVRQVLDAQGVQLPASSASEEWKDWLVSTFYSLNESHSRALLVTFWATWYACNKVVHDDSVSSPHITLAFVEAFLRETGAIKPAVYLTAIGDRVCWQAPMESIIKVNFDTAFDAQSKFSTSGVLCRNDEGLIMAACSLHPAS
ncbi:hypothetical protein V6N13_053993 [Hibiscus sabdariffa]